MSENPQKIDEGLLAFHFNDDQVAIQYDKWKSYREIFPALARKGVDIICIDKKNNCTYLIEVKDFRERKEKRGDEDEKRENTDWPLVIAQKMVDTIAGLYVASISNEKEWENETSFAKAALTKPVRIVFHCVVPKKLEDMLMDIYNDLRKKVKYIDPKCIVCSDSRFGWRVDQKDPQ